MNPVICDCGERATWTLYLPLLAEWRALCGACKPAELSRLRTLGNRVQARQYISPWSNPVSYWDYLDSHRWGPSSY